MKYLGLGAIIGGYPGAMYFGLNISERKRLISLIETLKSNSMLEMNAKDLTEGYIRKHSEQFAKIDNGYIKLEQLYRNIKNQVNYSTGSVVSANQVLTQGQYAQWLKNNNIKNLKLGAVLMAVGTLIGIGAGLYLKNKNEVA